MTPPDIGLGQLALGLVFILAALGASLRFGLGLHRELAVGAARTFGQLAAMGYALTFIFGLHHPAPTLAVYLVMLGAAARIVLGRVKGGGVPMAAPVFVSMLTAYTLVSVMVSGGIIGARPWWEPRVFVPIAGMVIGNSMSSLALALERLLSDLLAGRELVEMRLAHGADADEAMAPMLRSALRAGMMPSVMSLMGVGLVFIPGMMTGQLLAGGEPFSAARYQIVVMLMLVGAACLSTLLAVLWVRRRCFTPGLQLAVRE